MYTRMEIELATLTKPRLCVDCFIGFIGSKLIRKTLKRRYCRTIIVNFDIDEVRFDFVEIQKLIRSIDSNNVMLGNSCLRNTGPEFTYLWRIKQHWTKVK